MEREAHVDALKAEKANAEKVLTSSKGAESMKAAKDAEEKDQFWAKLEESKDLEDNLQDLTDFLQKNTNATGVYMGRLVYPSKSIEDDAEGDAHLDKEAPKVVKYLTGSKDHEFMVDVVLGPDEGITHDVFKD